ncbi:hypothetical protein D8674_036633 [Pyrus ussuriensis x Pyrus communis]|uniref:Uncharacterized protein n=1 Tax=Pyrus ussuriensis x Pyrus communis TaxID=2448454 RepID=A0A5N5I633_9ROSA|nr:hypothetical protein D8674_036633 [Pyrus ussuriensis x Pyrus communis]
MKSGNFACIKIQDLGFKGNLNQLLEFREAVGDCSIRDLGFKGNPFTWMTSRSGGIKKRLDRFFANDSWKQLFPGLVVRHLDPLNSDHVSIALTTRPRASTRQSHRPSFHIKEYWTHHPDCADVIHLAWAQHVSGYLMFQVVEKIKNTQLALNWVDLIMTCVSMVSYAFMINGVPKGYLYPTRGLRQNDPLSPYLFLLCAGGLSTLIAKKERDGLIQGVLICFSVSQINRLLFADDSFLFAKANVEECQQILLILRKPLDCNLCFVSDLIDAENRCWKEEVITELFSELEGNLIISLPISLRLLEDKVIWHFDKKGLFSVKSAYHVALDLITNRSHYASYSGDSHSSLIWKLI